MAYTTSLQEKVDFLSLSVVVAEHLELGLILDIQARFVLPPTRSITSKMSDCDSPVVASTSALPVMSSSSKRKQPKHRSCDGCRIRKIACSYRSEPLISFTTSSPASANSNAIPSVRQACRACAKKGIQCTIVNEDVPCRPLQALWSV